MLTLRAVPLRTPLSAMSRRSLSGSRFSVVCFSFVSLVALFQLLVFRFSRGSAFSLALGHFLAYFIPQLCSAFFFVHPLSGCFVFCSAFRHFAGFSRVEPCLPGTFVSVCVLNFPGSTWI